MTGEETRISMRPHKKLEVWIRSVDLVTKLYEATKGFPPDERFGLTSQIRRAAVSIPANISEGAARQTSKEFLQFLSIAQGSSSELETELLIAVNLGYLRRSEFDDLIADIESISRMLIGLSKYLRSKG